MDRNTKIIAVAGKGGVGKTSISAAFVRLLTETYPESRILAIDADPAVGLSTALGVEVKATLDDIRKGEHDQVPFQIFFVFHSREILSKSVFLWYAVSESTIT